TVFAERATPEYDRYQQKQQQQPGALPARGPQVQTARDRRIRQAQQRDHERRERDHADAHPPAPTPLRQRLLLAHAPLVVAGLLAEQRPAHPIERAHGDAPPGGDAGGEAGGGRPELPPTNGEDGTPCGRRIGTGIVRCTISSQRASACWHSSALGVRRANFTRSAWRRNASITSSTGIGGTTRRSTYSISRVVDSSPS